MFSPSEQEKSSKIARPWPKQSVEGCGVPAVSYGHHLVYSPQRIGVDKSSFDVTATPTGELPAFARILHPAKERPNTPHPVKYEPSLSHHSQDSGLQHSLPSFGRLDLNSSAQSDTLDSRAIRPENLSQSQPMHSSLKAARRLPGSPHSDRLLREAGMLWEDMDANKSWVRRLASRPGSKSLGLVPVVRYGGWLPEAEGGA
eukprot:1221669-Rhodomonas_salina.1